MERAKEALVTFWNWEHRPAALGGAAIVLGIGAVVASTSSFMQGPTAEQPPNAAEWLSAISTFWGAVATAIGAVLTGGALLIAALTYRSQAADKHQELVDKHRAHAQSISVVLTKMPHDEKIVKIALRNDSPLPIHDVWLVLLNDKLKILYQEPHYAVPGQSEVSFERPARIVGSVYADFTDSSATPWRRWFNGELHERTKVEQS